MLTYTCYIRRVRIYNEESSTLTLTGALQWKKVSLCIYTQPDTYTLEFEAVIGQLYETVIALDGISVEENVGNNDDCQQIEFPESKKIDTSC